MYKATVQFRIKMDQKTNAKGVKNVVLMVIFLTKKEKINKWC